jgi:predicted Zn-dependent protease
MRMSGGTTSLEEMIKTTKRGLLVTRFSGISLLDPRSLLSTGHTRDGLWLIENGVITRPVKNFRFTDSPLFMLNSVEALGTPVPVFHPEAPLIVPPIKSASFNFTRLADAV